MIRLKNVTKYYNSENNVTLALNNINLEFFKGEFVAITGKSGSGKSTLMNVISGMDTYQDGEIFFEGMETSCFSKEDWENYRRDKISFIYQSYQLIDSYTALENVEAVMRIMGVENKKERRKKAMEILDKVGLKKRARQKASHLSSGQKQRLGIARALAKDTDIIIADEPTGNLDVENGAAVMKMLYELSKDKLVIVVTHNFEQVKDYATRKIRLFDGEVAEDVKLKPELYENGVWKEKEAIVPKERKKEHFFRQAVGFVRLNRKAQPHRTFFVFLFLTVSIAALFVMYGYLLSNMDDSVTKNASQDVFMNTDKNRILVRKPDGSPFTEKDYDTLMDVRYVHSINPYDLASEISCLHEANKDYQVHYQQSEYTSRKSITVNALDYSDFTCNAAGVEQELIAGKLPEKRYDVVVASDDESLIGTTTDIYFRSQNWPESIYIGGTFQITGIVNPELGQPYFSDLFLSGINFDYANKNLQIEYHVLKTITDSVDAKYNREELLDRRRDTILVEGEGLTGNQIRLSESLIMNLKTEDNSEDRVTTIERLYSQGTLIDKTDSENPVEYQVEVLEDGHNGSVNVVEASREFMEQVYGSMQETQISVYIDDYAYTDRVIDTLNEMGYQAVSVFRISADEYDSVLVQERMTALGISAGSLIVIFFLSVVVIYTIMKLKRKDFMILTSLGLKQKTILFMNRYELVTGSILSCVLLICVAIIAEKYQIFVISDLTKYYQVWDYGIVTVLAVLMSWITAELFHRHLRKFLGGKQ